MRPTARRPRAPSCPADLPDAAPAGPLEEFPDARRRHHRGAGGAPYGVPADAAVQDPRLRRRRQALRRRPARRATNSRRRSSARWASALVAARHAGGDRAGHGREARQPRARSSGTIKNPAALAGIFADHAIRLVGNGVTGANRDGFHLRNVNVTRDLAITRFGDFRRVRAGRARAPDRASRSSSAGRSRSAMSSSWAPSTARSSARPTPTTRSKASSWSWAATASASAGRCRP